MLGRRCSGRLEALQMHHHAVDIGARQGRCALFDDGQAGRFDSFGRDAALGDLWFGQRAAGIGVGEQIVQGLDGAVLETDQAHDQTMRLALAYATEDRGPLALPADHGHEEHQHARIVERPAFVDCGRVIRELKAHAVARDIADQHRHHRRPETRDQGTHIERAARRGRLPRRFGGVIRRGRTGHGVYS